MVKKQKLKIEIEVWGIEVEETSKYQDGTGNGWYKFEYSIRKNSGRKKYGEIDGSWSSQTKTQYVKKLRSSWALDLVIQSMI